MDQETAPARRLIAQVDRFLPLVDRAIARPSRRVLGGETVPAGEKLLSLFEPHTRLITRHKAGKPVEFGCKLMLDEVDGGIVSRYDVVEGRGSIIRTSRRASRRHCARFERAPDLLAGDRGLYTAANEELARQAGVKRVVLPAVGWLSRQRQEHERQPWFRRGFRFRAGIEGRISVLKRGYELGRCRDHGEGPGAVGRMGGRDGQPGNHRPDRGGAAAGRRRLIPGTSSGAAAWQRHPAQNLPT